jgi:hypothetical protein
VTDVFATSRDLVKANKQQFTHLRPKHHTKLLRVPITDRTQDLFPYLSAHNPPLDTKRLRRLPTPQRAWPKHHSPTPRVVTLRLHPLQTRAQQTHNQFTNAHTNSNIYKPAQKASKSRRRNPTLGSKFHVTFYFRLIRSCPGASAFCNTDPVLALLIGIRACRAGGDLGCFVAQPGIGGTVQTPTDCELLIDA